MTTYSTYSFIIVASRSSVYVSDFHASAVSSSIISLAVAMAIQLKDPYNNTVNTIKSLRKA